LTDFPDIVTDWVYAPLVPLDIARRVFFALERRCSIKFGLQFAGVTVIPETRQVVYEGQSVRLTSSEYTLLELFVKRMGAVIPSHELALFFKSSGKSAEPNNIRVSIFQLRMKLESITRSRVTLASVHKQGYRLRQKSAFSSVIHPAHMVPNELSASVLNCIDSGQMTYGKL
jgi:DNA-binding response OmpR family regulator